MISNENIDTYVWLFRSCLACMFGCAPNAIITDQDKAMQKAIEVVFPHDRRLARMKHKKSATSMLATIVAKASRDVAKISIKLGHISKRNMIRCAIASVVSSHLKSYIVDFRTLKLNLPHKQSAYLEASSNRNGKSLKPDPK